ncbi:MAG: ATP-binding protein [Methanobacteriota archaeon]
MISKEILRQILIQQQITLMREERTIPRELIHEILPWSSDNRILILTGLRRSGKSTLLRQLMQKVKPSCYVNFEDERFLDFQASEFESLHEVLLEIYRNASIYFFDEIQNIPQFETFVRRLQDQGKKIVITGSNASLLSYEFGTRLTGRYKSFEVYPFSFHEFLQLHQITPQKNWFYLTEKKALLVRQFNEYLNKGGIPEYLKNNDIEYVKTIYENILYRDIVARYLIKQQHVLRELVNLLVTNMASPYTYNSLKNTLKLSNAITVKEYISYLHNSYLFFEVHKFDYSLRKQLNAPKKIYVVDPVFHQVCGMNISLNKGRLLENLVFIDLRRRKQEVYYFSGSQQCDFIIKNGTKITYAIQVCYVLDETNRDRELKGLLEALTTFRLKEGLLLTQDQEEEINLDKKIIHVVPVWKWLLLKNNSNTIKNSKRKTR